LLTWACIHLKTFMLCNIKDALHFFYFHSCYQRADGLRDASGSSTDSQQFNEARSVAHDLIYHSRADVLTAKVIKSAGDSKKMWNTARQLLHSTPAHQHAHWAMKTGLRCRVHSISSSPIRLLAYNRKSLKSLKQWTISCSRRQGHTPALHSSPSRMFHQQMCQRCWARGRTSLRLVTYFRHRCWNRAPTCSLHWLIHSQRAHSRRCLRQLKCFHCWRNQA